MKKINKVVSLVVAILFAASPFAFASTSVNTAAIPISATVDSALAISVSIKEQTSADGVVPVTFGPSVASMDHGTLIRSNAADGTPNALRGKAFHVWVGALTSSRPYTVTSTMNAMISGVNTLPRALGVFPISAYTGIDGSGNPISAGGTLASAQDAVGTGKLLYTSTAAGPAATVELVYGLSGGLVGGGSPFTGWQAIPPGQAPGTYTSTITFTLTV